MRAALERFYGHGPGHLVAMLICYAFAAYAIGSIFANAAPWRVLIWLVGGILLHEFVLFPLYTGIVWVLARVLGADPPRRSRVRLVQHLVAPLALSGLLLLTWMPLILRLSETNYRPTTGMSQDPFLWRWLGITIALVVLSALVAFVRSRRAPQPLPETSAGPAGTEHGADLR